MPGAGSDSRREYYEQQRKHKPDNAEYRRRKEGKPLYLVPAAELIAGGDHA